MYHNCGMIGQRARDCGSKGNGEGGDGSKGYAKGEGKTVKGTGKKATAQFEGMTFRRTERLGIPRTVLNMRQDRTQVVKMSMRSRLRR